MKIIYPDIRISYPAVLKLTEHQIQSGYFTILSWNEGKYPFLKYIYAIPNGGHRHIGVAKKMKAEGVKRGVPDIFIPIAMSGYHGCYLETKTVEGRLSPEQKVFKAFLESQKYLHLVCRSIEELIEQTETYLKIQIQGK